MAHLNGRLNLFIIELRGEGEQLAKGQKRLSDVMFKRQNESGEALPSKRQRSTAAAATEEGGGEPDQSSYISRCD